MHQLHGRITEANTLLVRHKGGKPFTVESTEVRQWQPVEAQWCVAHDSIALTDDQCDQSYHEHIRGCDLRPLHYRTDAVFVSLNEGALDLGIVKP